MTAAMQATAFGRTLIIANPVAQEGACARIAGELQCFLALTCPDDGPFELVETEEPGHATRLAADAAGFDTVLVAGGDGVIHEAANGLMALADAARPVLGVVPAGSGNDYARTLGISDWHGRSFGWLLRCAPVTMDAGRIEVTDPAGRRSIEHYVQTCSFGLDAAIALGTASLRETTPLRGDALYTASGLKVFVLEYARHPVKVRFDDEPETLSLESIIFAVQIGRTYGSGFQICPEADPSDGVLDVCYAAGRVPRAVALPLLLRAKSGAHVGSRHVTLRRARRVELDFARPDYPIQADGEKIVATRLVVDVVPGALRVLQPVKEHRS